MSAHFDPVFVCIQEISLQQFRNKCAKSCTSRSVCCGIIYNGEKLAMSRLYTQGLDKSCFLSVGMHCSCLRRDLAVPMWQTLEWQCLRKRVTHSMYPRGSSG